MMIFNDDDPETPTPLYNKHSGWAYASDRMVEKFSDSYPSILLFLLPEFTIIKHAHLKTRGNFSVVMILLAPVLIMDYLVPHDASSGLQCLVISFRLSFAIFTYVLLIFVQLYHVLLALSLTEDFSNNEDLTELKIELKQTEKKFWIRKLYRFFLIRDLLIFPAFLLPDIGSMDHRGYLLYYGEVFLVSTHITIYAMVPISLLFYFLMKKLKIAKDKVLNPLEHQVLYQAVGITLVQVTLLAVSWCLSHIGWIPGEILPHIPQSGVLTFPLVIQVSTGMWSRKFQREIRPNSSSRMFSE